MSVLAVDKQRNGSRMKRIGLNTNSPLQVFFSALDEEWGAGSSQIFKRHPGTLGEGVSIQGSMESRNLLVFSM